VFVPSLGEESPPFPFVSSGQWLLRASSSTFRITDAFQIESEATGVSIPEVRPSLYLALLSRCGAVIFSYASLPRSFPPIDGMFSFSLFRFFPPAAHKESPPITACLRLGDFFLDDQSGFSGRSSSPGSYFRFSLPSPGKRGVTFF